MLLHALTKHKNIVPAHRCKKIMLKKTFQYHKTLCPKIWDSDLEINQLVSQSLQMMSFEYIRYLGTALGLPISTNDIVDIFIHGSLTNYYWDKHSDIDLCIITNLKSLRERLPNLNHFLFFNATQRAWKSTFRPSIYGRNVDIFIMDPSEVNAKLKNTVDTFYSLFTNKWILAPKRIQKDELKMLKKMTHKRYRVIMRQCKCILKNKMSHEFIDAYLIALQNHRTNSVLNANNNSMTSTQMAFKMARNTNIISKMRRASREQLSRRYKLS